MELLGPAARDCSPQAAQGDHGAAQHLCVGPQPGGESTESQPAMLRVLCGTVLRAGWAQ